MRTMIKVEIPVEAGNKAAKEVTLGATFEQLFSRTKPEAAYFLAPDGERCCIAVFDLQDTVDIPSIAEPLFMALNARVTFNPVMNAENLKQGLSRLK